jgi:phospholipase/carboxylesterase
VAVSAVKLLHAGEPLESARVAVVMLHGRGSNAEDILSLSADLEAPGVAFLAPEAPGGAWYPQRFIVPTAQNEPWLSAALETVKSAIAATKRKQHQIALLGFSQGACLALETALRVGGRFKAVIGLSGGLIGADEELGAHAGENLAGTPIFLGCSDVDFHIPLERVKRSAAILEAHGAKVDARIYPNFGHTINADELEAARNLLWLP